MGPLVVVLLVWSAFGQSELTVMALPANGGQASRDLTAGADQSWLLMVEAGQGEHRRITPKSVFIAPAITNRAQKCPEGHRYDHLGRCVKVMKVDPAAQLELLLKRLRDTKIKAQPPAPQPLRPPSAGPLHFSIPLVAKPVVSTEPSPPTDILPVRTSAITERSTTTESSDPAISDTDPVSSGSGSSISGSDPVSPGSGSSGSGADPQISGEGPESTTGPVIFDEFSGQSPTETTTTDGSGDDSTTPFIDEFVEPETTTVLTRLEKRSTTMPSSLPELEEAERSTIVTDDLPDITTRKEQFSSMKQQDEWTTPTTGDSTEESTPSDDVFPTTQETATTPPIPDLSSHTDPSYIENTSSTTQNYTHVPLRIVVPPSEDYITIDSKSGDSTNHSLVSNSSHVRFPDEEEEAAVEDTGPKNPYWWLPDDWDDEKNRPTILKFWSKIPVIQPPVDNQPMKEPKNNFVPSADTSFPQSADTSFPHSSGTSSFPHSSDTSSFPNSGDTSFPHSADTSNQRPYPSQNVRPDSGVRAAQNSFTGPSEPSLVGIVLPPPKSSYLDDRFHGLPSPKQDTLRYRPEELDVRFSQGPQKSVSFPTFSVGFPSSASGFPPKPLSEEIVLFPDQDFDYGDHSAFRDSRQSYLSNSRESG